MNILFEIADKDLLVICLALVALVILGIVIFQVISKKNKVMPIAEDERFDAEEEVIDERELTPEQLEAKAELERVFNQMSKDLEEKEETVIEDFEREQEENAIISYQELMKQARAKNLIKDEAIVSENNNDILSNYFIDEEKEEKKEPYQEQMNFEEEEPKKFKNSEIISPIFGIQSEGTVIKAKEKPKHAKTKEERIPDDNNEFLSSLKEFRSSL